MARQITISIELNWQPELARYFKTEVTDKYIEEFCFGISENTVFSYAIIWLDERGIRKLEVYYAQIC
jgi:hypothetical protein